MDGPPVNRRTVLGGLAAGAVLAASPVRVRADKADRPDHLLRAMAGEAQLLDPGMPKTPVWTYGGQVPGPLLRLRQGAETRIRLENALAQPTTVHWHGLRIDNAMDGVAGLTQEAVPPGGSFDYVFTAPDAGTYWYHTHNRSSEQLARGLYGPLIVVEAEPPAVDQDLLFVVDDWRLTRAGPIDEASFGSFHDRAHAGRIGNVVTVNGKPFETFPVQAGERVRLRLINTANARVMQLSLTGLDASVIALDGQPVSPFKPGNGRLTLAPAQRADVMIDMTGAPGSRTEIREVSTDNAVPVAAFAYDGSARRREGVSDAPMALPVNPLPKRLDLHQPLKVPLVMTGGAMSWFDSAIYKGKRLPVRELVRKHGQVWAFNGVANMPAKPLFTAKRGQTVVLAMDNQTRWPHGMHVHGHHFIDVGRGPGAPKRYWRDTVLMQPMSRLTVGFIADNPGKWLIHCHMVEHMAGGMVTWFEVA